MTEELRDKEDSDTSSDSRSEETEGSSNAAGGDKNADELENTRKELDSLKQALKEEREKNRKKGFSEKKEEESKRETELDTKSLDNETTFERLYNDRRAKELQEDRVEYEEEVKKEMVKRFPALKADNSFGIKNEIIEAYNDLLEGRVKRGLFPRSKNTVSELVEKAVRIVHPEFFVKSSKEDNTDYEGAGVSEGLLPLALDKPKLSAKEKSLVGFIEEMGYKDKK